MSGSQDPWATAGFAPAQAGQVSAAGDPWAAAGFAAQTPPPSTPPQRTNLGVNLPGQMPIFGDPKLNEAFVEGAPRVGEKVAEGATFGMFPYIAAAGRMLTGEPWSKALQESRDYTAESTKQDPATSAIAEGIGSLAPATGAVKVAAPVVRAVGSIPYAGSTLAQAMLGGALGGANTAGHDVGSGETANLGSDTAKGAGVGAALGGVLPTVGRALQVVPNMVSGAYNAVRNIVGGPGRDAVAGQILREASGNFVNDAANSPVPGLNLRTAQATGNPGIASLERTLASEPGTQATLPGQLVQNGRTPDQMHGLVSSLVGENAGQEPSILTNEASARGTQAIQGSRDVLRQAENDLWNAPELRGVRLHSEPLIAGVQNDVAHMPPSLRMAVGGGPLAGLMADVSGIQNGASIQDVNAIRSRILEQARASRAAGDNVTGAAAEGLAGSLLNRTEGALGDAGAAVRDAYSTARDFTRQRAQTLGYPEFEAMLAPNKAGNIQANDETAFGKFFDLPGGTDTGLQRLQGLSDLLRSTGQPEAINQANALEGAARDYLRSGVLRQARAGAGLDATGAPATNPATLATTINRQMPAVTGAPMVADIAPDLQASGRAAELLNRPSTLRGDTNSTTFEKLRNRDLVSAIVGQTGSSSLGAVAGGYGAYEYGPKSAEGADLLPWYARVPAGMLAGALLGQRMGPYVGRIAAHIPGASMAVTGPTNDIMGRLSAALADPAEYQRLMATQLRTGPNLTAPGAISTRLPPAATAAIPMLTGRNGQ